MPEIDELLKSEIKNTRGGTCHVLAIAVDSYADLMHDGAAIPLLTKPRIDAEEVFQILLEQYEGFSTDNLTLLAGDEAQLSRVEAALGDIIPKLRPEDQLLVYYSGHGVLDKATRKIWKFLLHPEGDGASVLANAANFSSVFDTLAEVDNCSAIFLVLDACHAQAVFQNVNSRQTAVPCYALTAATSAGVSFEDFGGAGSPFVRSLKEVLGSGNGLNRPFWATEVVKNLRFGMVSSGVPQEVECSRLGNPVIGGQPGRDARNFIFKFKGKNPPPLAAVERLFLDKLDFKRQRTVFEEGPDEAPGNFDLNGHAHFVGLLMPERADFDLLVKSLLGWVRDQWKEGEEPSARRVINPQLLDVTLVPDETDGASFDWERHILGRVPGEAGKQADILARKVADCLKASACILVVKIESSVLSDGFAQQALCAIAEAVVPKVPTDNPFFMLVCDLCPTRAGFDPTGDLGKRFAGAGFNFRRLPRFGGLSAQHVTEWLAELKKIRDGEGQPYPVSEALKPADLFDPKPAEVVRKALEKLGHDPTRHSVFDFNLKSIFS